MADPRTVPLSLAALVVSRRGELLARWTRRTRIDLGEALEGAALVDSMPNFVDGLIAALARGVPRGRAPATPGAAAETGRSHGEQRAGTDVKLEQVIWEYGLLRDVVLDLAEEAGLTPSVAEIRILTDCIMGGVAEAARAFTAARSAKVAESEARFRAFADHAPAALFVKDAGGRFVFANETTCRLHGVPCDRLLGRTDAELVPADAAARFREGDARALAGEHVELREELPAREDRPARTFFTVKFPLRLESGELGVAGIALDITAEERARAEALREGELLDLGDAFFELDREWRMVRVNRNQERLSRKPRAETLGRRFWDLWPELASPDDVYWREYHRVMEERVPREFDAYYAPLDLWTAVTAYPVTGGGIAVFFRDATRRKRAERERDETLSLVENILTTAPVGLALVDAQLRFVRINSAMARMNGVPVDATLGRTIREVLPVMAGVVEPLFRRVFETGRAIPEQELTGATHGTPAGHWLAAWFPVPDATGRTSLAGVVVVDITERKRAELRLREAGAFAQQLVGIVSHDLRNPLNAILLGAGALLAREDLPERALAGLARIRSAGERAARLTNDLLDLTRARLGGGIPVLRRPADLGALAQQAIDEVSPAHPDREVRLQVEGDATGSWDPDRIVQLLQNLVTNALKYGAASAPVEVRVEAKGPEARLSVHNAGEPIAPEHLARIFDPWERGGRPADGHLGSAGLGLYIVERIAAAHGGRVEATSTREAGTTFAVTLPRAPAS